MPQKKEKKELAIIQAHSLRDLLNQVNEVNFNDSKPTIMRDDIIGLQKIDDTYFLLYFR